MDTGGIAGFLRILLIRDVFRLMSLGCYLPLYFLLGAVLTAIVGLLMLWLLWR